MKKKGLEMAITTVILIILSISVLTVLIVFFNSQTGFLNRWFSSQSSKSNVDAVMSGCNSLVSSESVYSYCCEEKEVIFADKKKESLSCFEMASDERFSGRVDLMECLIACS